MIRNIRITCPIITTFVILPQRPCYVCSSMKYQFEDWRRVVLLSQAGEALFSLGWQSPRDGVSIKILSCQSPKLIGVSKGIQP